MTVDDIGALDPDVAHEPNPAAWDPIAKLRDMDAMGVSHSLLYPTLFGEQFPLVENPDVAAVLARAYNDWVLEFASAAPDRLSPVAVLPLQSALLARQELERVIDLGFGAVVLRPMFHGPPTSAQQRARRTTRGGGSLIMSYDNPRGVFLLDERYDWLWGALEAAAVVACIHPYLGFTNPEGTSAGSFLERVAAPLGLAHPVGEAVVRSQDASLFLVAALFQGLLEDHPELRLALTHAGASWVPLALEKAETYLWLSFPSVFAPAERPVSLEPEHVFEQHPALVTFDPWETSVGRLHEELTGVVAWGSRSPAHDAAMPSETLEMLRANGVPESSIARMMGGNAIELFRLPVPAPAQAG
jgi:predicted TIM-barrel fold metal-dependent hydrolase